MFNLFHQRHDPSVVCAIRQASAVPRFLDRDHWRYGGQAESIESEAAAFDNAAAMAVIEKTGFYLFHAHH